MSTEIQEMVERARVAQQEFEQKFTEQDKIDQVVEAIGKAIYDHAEELAKLAVEETRMGVFEDKVMKNKNKSKNIWYDLKGKKSVGVIDRDETTGMMTIAKPMGVIGGITPTTNPNVTPMSKAMFAVKSRNAIIISPHPRSKKSSGEAIRLIKEAIAPYGVPKDLIQIIQEPSIEKTAELMKAVDVIVATGGAGMVKAAYSSGKPSFGVGAGNAQVIIDEGVDLDEAVDKAITGRKFDNGIICSGEQSLIYPRKQRENMLKAIAKAGGYVVPVKERQKVIHAIFQDGMTAKDVVGQGADVIARKAGITIPAETKVLVVESNGHYGREDDIAKEKMCPVMGMFPYDNFEEAICIAEANLKYEGNGHSVAIHSQNQNHILRAGETLTVSRLVVNAVCSTTAGGVINNGLAPTNTLGCGSWGNNSISENFTYKHLMNTTRVAPIASAIKLPSDAEIWA